MRVKCGMDRQAAGQGKLVGSLHACNSAPTKITLSHCSLTRLVDALVPCINLAYQLRRA